jgi:hypothetical protein
MNTRADAIRECFDGTVPSFVSTCGEDGRPNVTLLSHAQFVDPQHLALSYQFFNKTRRNVLANPHVKLLLIHPLSAAQYRLTLRYLRTETEGPLFEAMKAKLAGIASHTGMSGVFRLLGADLYRILHAEKVAGPQRQVPDRPNLLTALRDLFGPLDRAVDLESLLARSLEGLASRFDIQQAMVLMLDGSGRKLYTVASHGYETSGTGSEIPLGQGVVGICAASRTPIRIGHATSEYAYSRAIRESALRHGLAERLETEIPYPGLETPGSQLAVPVQARGRLLGVLYVESPWELRFSYDDEDALVVLAAHLGRLIEDLDVCEAVASQEPAPDASPVVSACVEPGQPLTIRYYPENDSVFLGEDYLIKGVAGSIFWTLAKDFAERGRREFTNRELRLDPRIKLPDLSDNLEARLVLLSRRLIERKACVRMEKTGRGRFRLMVDRPLHLQEIIS